MKNRVKLIVALLASVLVVCGMFTMTSFADDPTPTPAPGHVHEWKLVKPDLYPDTFPKESSLAFRCTKGGCDYAERKLVKLVAKDDIYLENVEYAADELIGLAGDVEAFENSGDLTLSDPTFYKGNTKLSKAPVDVGTYKAKVDVLKNGKSTGLSMVDSFAILSASVEVKDNVNWDDNDYLEYGEKVGPENFKITVGDEIVDSEKCSFYFTSLDTNKSELSEKFPQTAGHYEVMVIIPKTETRNGGIVEEKFEIKQTRNGFSFFPLSLDPSALQNVDMTDRSFNALNVLLKLVESGVVKLPVGSDTTFVKPINYGEPVFIAAFYNGKLYNPAQMGKITIKYSGTTASGKTVSGTFIPGITLLNAGKYTFSGKITETKNVAYDTFDFEDVIITQRVPKMIAEPEAVEGLVVNGKYQKLVTAGKLLNSRHGKILYSYKKVAADGEDNTGYSSYSSLVPTAKDAGEYVVKYKVIATENKNFKDSDEVKIKVRIAATEEELNPDDDEEEAVPSDTPVPAAKSVKVEGKRRAMKVSWKAIDSADLAKVSNVEIQYSKDKNFKKGLKTRRVGKSKTAATIKFLKKGTYYVRVRNVRYNNIITSDGIDTNTPVKTSSDWSKTKKVVVK